MIFCSSLESSVAETSLKKGTNTHVMSLRYGRQHPGYIDGDKHTRIHIHAGEGLLFFLSVKNKFL